MLMAEILLCVHDRSATGDPAIDSKAPKQGDVIIAVPNEWVWGECELGGPNYRRHITKCFFVSATFDVLSSFDLSKVTTVDEIPRINLLRRTVSQPVEVDGTGKPDGDLPVVIDDIAHTITQSRYVRRVIGTDVRPITEHPNGNHSFFRIIKLPNVSVAAASTLLAPELPVDPLNPSPYLQYRGFFLDKTKFPKVLLDHWNDDNRVAQFLTLNISTAQFNTLKSQRTPVPF